MTETRLAEASATRRSVSYSRPSTCCPGHCVGERALPLIYAGYSKADREEMARSSEKCELEERSHHKPNELSGGQRQRVHCPCPGKQSFHYPGR